MIADYTELQARVLGLSNRPDMAAFVPMFISLAETRMQADIGNWLLDASVSVPVLASALFVDFPEDLLQIKSVSINKKELRLTNEQISLEKFDSGDDIYAVIKGRTLSFSKALSAAANVVFFYKKKLLALSATVPANDLLKYADDAYLYATMCKLHEYTMDSEKVAYFDAQYQTAMRNLNTQNYMGTASISYVNGAV
jgi:hypothetical protein